MIWGKYLGLHSLSRSPGSCMIISVVWLNVWGCMKEGHIYVFLFRASSCIVVKKHFKLQGWFYLLMLSYMLIEFINQICCLLFQKCLLVFYLFVQNYNERIFVLKVFYKIVIQLMCNKIIKHSWRIHIQMNITNLNLEYPCLCQSRSMVPINLDFWKNSG